MKVDKFIELHIKDLKAFFDWLEYIRIDDSITDEEKKQQALKTINDIIYYTKGIRDSLEKLGERGNR